METTATNVLMDQSVVARILKQLSEKDREQQGKMIRENGLGVSKSKQFTDLEQAVASMLTGDVLLFVDGCDVAVSLADKGYPGKPVGNCEAEKVIRGSSEGFCDSVKTNEALVRKRIRST